MFIIFKKKWEGFKLNLIKKKIIAHQNVEICVNIIEYVI